tara:strand:+ start:370 stop:558 length:189 start_codon:yes stop_codon:yes gene_type:complete
MIELKLTLLRDVLLSKGILDMVDKVTSANTFIFILEEEEVEMLIDELEETIKSHYSYSLNYV